MHGLSVSVSKNAPEVVVGEHSVWIKFIADVDETTEMFVHGCQLVERQIMMLAPVWFTASFQHHLLYRLK